MHYTSYFTYMIIYCFERPQHRIEKFFNKKIKFRYNKKNSKIPKNIKHIYIKLKYFIGDKILNKIPTLTHILTPTTGINHIDLNSIKKRGIKIIKLNTKNQIIKNINSTSEFVLTLILSSIRKIFKYKDNFKNNIRDRYSENVLQFKNYTIGIIGLGRIGTYLYKSLKYLGFEVLTYDKKKDKYSKLNTLLKKSDVITLNISASKNYNFFDKQKFNRLKKNVIFINTSRGELVNEDDLLRFLKKNKTAFAILDVIKNEQQNLLNSKILKYNKMNKNLVLFPHIGGATIDAMEIADKYVFQQLLKKYEK